MFSMDETADVGSDAASPVSPEYGPTDSAFTGTIEWVRIDLGDDDHSHHITDEHKMQRRDDAPVARHTRGERPAYSQFVLRRRLDRAAVVVWNRRGGESPAMEIGYFLSSEEHPPSSLVDQARFAERVGIDRVWISDHFHPWLDEQGHSPFVWSVIGAIAAVTDCTSALP